MPYRGRPDQLHAAPFFIWWTSFMKVLQIGRYIIFIAFDVSDCKVIRSAMLAFHFFQTHQMGDYFHHRSDGRAISFYVIGDVVFCAI